MELVRKKEFLVVEDLDMTLVIIFPDTCLCSSCYVMGILCRGSRRVVTLSQIHVKGSFGLISYGTEFLAKYYCSFRFCILLFIFHFLKHINMYTYKRNFNFYFKKL